MNPTYDEFAFELAQHEDAGTRHWFELDRRNFMKMMGGGLLVCIAANKLLAQESGHGTGEHQLPQDIATWLHIGEDSRITVFTGKVEMGQNIRTSLAQQVAEELHVALNAIDLIMGDTAQVPWDAGTFGSRTTPTMGPQLRSMSAAARDLLIAMAARRWSTDPSTLVAENGTITNPKTHLSLTYGDLTHGQRLVKVVTDPALEPPDQWKIVGTPVPKVHGKDFVRGKHQYTSDFLRPGLQFGKVLRPAGFNAKLISLDVSEAERIPGVKVVRDGDFVGVAAPDQFAAERAVKALRAQWNVPPQISNQELFEFLKKNADPSEHGFQHVIGSVEQAMASADTKIAQTYTVQYIAHAPLEPRAAVAEWNGDHLSVWTGTQRPFSVRDELAQAFRISPDKVRVMVPDTGSAYGGKHTGEAAIEAARLAKATGRPVKLVWTREEEFTWAYFRPAGVIEARSGARKDGSILTWEFHNYNSGPAAITTPYNVPNQSIHFHPVKSPLRQGSYRALAATANHFARETHMDELAHELGIGPLEFRLKNIADPRLRTVFLAAADKFGWQKQKTSPERGYGIAGGFEKGGYVATCAEVEIDPTTHVVQIRRVVEAFDCGAVVNPDGLRNQISGAIMQAVGGALFEAVKFENGRILNAHFAAYRVPRFKDTPEIEVVIPAHKDHPPAGAGETPIVGLAPAVGNAIFAATGIRLRALPLVPDAVPQAAANGKTA